MYTVMKQIVSLLMAACLTGCVNRGEYVSLSVTSTPADADVTIRESSGIITYMGKTPAKVRVFAKNDECFSVRVAKDGYEPQYAKVNAEVSAGYLTNLFLFGWVGFFSGELFGGKYGVDASSVDVTLLRIGEIPTTDPNVSDRDRFIRQQLDTTSEAYQ